MVRAVGKVADLSIGEKQQVEILTHLYQQGTLLIFLEPTAVLTPTVPRGAMEFISIKLKKCCCCGCHRHFGMDEAVEWRARASLHPPVKPVGALGS